MFIKNKTTANVIQNTLYNAITSAGITGTVKLFTGEEYTGIIKFLKPGDVVNTRRNTRWKETRVAVGDDSDIDNEFHITEVLYVKTNTHLTMLRGIVSKPYLPNVRKEFENHPIYKKILRWMEKKVPVGFILYNGVFFKGTISAAYPYTYIVSLYNEDADVIIPKHSITVITDLPDEFYAVYLNSFVRNKNNMPDLQHAVPKSVWWKHSLTNKLLGTIKYKKFVSVLLRDHSVSFLGRAAMLSPTIYAVKIYVRTVPDDYAKWRSKVTGKKLNDYRGGIAMIYRHAIKGIRWVKKNDLIRTPTSEKAKKS